MARILLLALLTFVPAAAEWTFFRSGPIEVMSDGEDEAARKLLATFDQVRHWTARVLGRTELNPLWPVRLVVVKPERAHAQYRTKGIRLVRDRYTGGLSSRDPVPMAWITGFVQILLNDDVKPLPASFESGLIAVMSTIQVDATRLTLGTPPAPAARTRDWARMHLLTLAPEYQVRARVLLGNLQQGAELDIAYRNAFEKTEKEMEAEIDRYFAAGRFEPQQISGKPLDPERDYRHRSLTQARVKVALADLLEGAEAAKAYRGVLNESGPNAEAFEGAGMLEEATQHGSDSAPVWVAYARGEKDPVKARNALQKAMSLNPRWAEPHAVFASMETAAERKVPPLKKAVELERRNLSYWIALAEAQTEARDYKGAMATWRSAERSASSDQDRARINARRLAYEQERLDLEAAERRRVEEERQKELDKLREEALASIRAAEARANAGAGAADPNRKVVEWWDGPKPASVTVGRLERVDCGRGPARWSVRGPDGKVKQFTVADPTKIVVVGKNEATLGCGPQRPARQVKIEAGAAGEVLTVEFQ